VSSTGERPIIEITGLPPIPHGRQNIRWPGRALASFGASRALHSFQTPWYNGTPDDRHAEKERLVSWSAFTSPGRAALSSPRGTRPGWHWQWLCALALCTTVPLLYLFASICLATGIFHHETPHQAHHHPASPDAPHASGLPDICDFAHQALTTTVTAPVPLLPGVLLPGEPLPPPPRVVLPIARVSCLAIRAPPLVHA
jgi:hypothetical protein